MSMSDKRLKRIIAQLPTGYAEDMSGVDDAKYRQEMLRAEDNLAETAREKDADEKLAGAKELVKTLSQGYADAEKAQRAKIAWCLYMLEQRGTTASKAGPGELG